ncbi:MAG: TraR/DksA C4-type zinc finger protein [Pelosinus sp.]|nr:TraR/DksA C4-type zinc finger protein [Pelosinus sp.]
MKEEDCQELAEKLRQEHAMLLAQIESLEENGLNEAMSQSLGELSMYDNHPADVGQELFERSKDIGLQDNARIMLESVDKALAKIHDTQYGICEKCGQKIALERLQAIPWADKCLACQEASEESDDFPRPLEEELLSPPFTRSFLDRADYTGFDGEDAVQAVLRYGSSDSPQDIPGTTDYKALYPNHHEHQGIVERTDAIPASTQEAEP